MKPRFEYNQRLYDMWLKYSGQYRAIEQCIKQHLPAAIHRLFPRDDDDTTFDILSIGSGNGDVDVRILESVVECLDKEDGCHDMEVCNTAIEPSTAQFQHYEHMLQRKAHSFQKSFKKVIKFDLKNETFEDYQRSVHDKNRFDVIHGVYSFGFLNDPMSAFKNCYENELKTRGFIAAVMANGDTNDIFQKVASVLNRNRPEKQESHRATWLSPSDVTGHANLNYERIPFSSSLDVTDISDENSENFSLLLDLFTCENNFCQTADKRLVKEVCQLVRECAYENDQGRLVVDIDNELILIHKST